MWLSMGMSEMKRPDILKTPDAALLLDVSEWKVRQLARRCSVGYNVGGKSGWRFSPA